MKACPFCAEEIQDAAVKCKHCGSIIENAVGQSSNIPSYKTPQLLPKDFLLPDEIIYLEIRPYWSDYFAATGFSIFVTLFIIFSSLVNKTSSSWITFLIITAIIFFINNAQWKKAVYAITNKRVIQIKGLVSKDYKQCPLDKVQNIDLKVVGLNSSLGHISFDTAGTSSKEIVWRYVLKPKEVYQQISAILHR